MGLHNSDDSILYQAWMVMIRLILLITGKSITKKCDDPIKESGEGPKENVLQHRLRVIAIHHGRDGDEK